MFMLVLIAPLILLMFLCYFCFSLKSRYQGILLLLPDIFKVPPPPKKKKERKKIEALDRLVHLVCSSQPGQYKILLNIKYKTVHCFL